MFRVVRNELWLIWDWDLVFYDGWVLGSYLAFIFRRVENEGEEARAKTAVMTGKGKRGYRCLFGCVWSKPIQLLLLWLSC